MPMKNDLMTKISEGLLRFMNSIDCMLDNV